MDSRDSIQRSVLPIPDHKPLRHDHLRCIKRGWSSCTTESARGAPLSPSTVDGKKLVTGGSSVLIAFFSRWTRRWKSDAIWASPSRTITATATMRSTAR